MFDIRYNILKNYVDYFVICSQNLITRVIQKKLISFLKKNMNIKK